MNLNLLQTLGLLCLGFFVSCCVLSLAAYLVGKAFGLGWFRAKKSYEEDKPPWDDGLED